NYTLTFNGIDNLSQFNCIQLEDVRLGKTVQIEEGSSYTYQLDNTGTYKFILHFKKLQPGLPCVITTLANNVTENLDEAVDVYKSQTGVTAKFTLSESQQAIISVYNTLGQKVEQDIVKDVMDEQVDIPLPSTNGMYIIRIETPSGVTTKRIYQ
ncbi:MAG: T9SS type A sorting domain-containing protein, partial [Alphaproteobacteria bacterium]